MNKNKNFREPLTSAQNVPVSNMNPPKKLSGFLDGSLQRVKLSDIRINEKNPRVGVNPAYNDIKDSIKAIGLQNKFAITLIEGEDQYVTYGGGNTRLEILKELNKESGGKDYEYIEVEFRKYQGEDVSFARHITENQLRSGFSFLNFAKIVADFKAMNERDSDVELTTVELEKLAKAQGFVIHRAMVNPLLLASELYPIFQNLMEKGVSDEDTDANGISKLGRPRFDRLLKIVNQLTSIVEDKGLTEKDVKAIIYDSVEMNSDAFMGGDFEKIEEYACRKISIKTGMALDDVKHAFKLAKNPELKKSLEEEAKVKQVDKSIDVIADCEKSKKAIRKVISNIIDINPSMKDYIKLIDEDPSDLATEVVFSASIGDGIFYDNSGTYINLAIDESEFFIIVGVKHLSDLTELAVAINLIKDKDIIQEVVDDIKDAEHFINGCRFYSDMNIFNAFGIKGILNMHPETLERTQDTYVLLAKLHKLVNKYISQLELLGQAG